MLCGWYAEPECSAYTQTRAFALGESGSCPVAAIVRFGDQRSFIYVRLSRAGFVKCSFLSTANAGINLPGSGYPCNGGTRMKSIVAIVHMEIRS